MTRERLQQVEEMLPGWRETDTFSEDMEKTTVIEELLAELASGNVPAQQDR
jgi:hypothetical protein